MPENKCQDGYIRIVDHTFERVSSLVRECNDNNAILQVSLRAKQIIICDKLLRDFAPVYPTQNGMQAAA
jgi:hypothetical protein